ncbi:mCG1028489 [Mus musculus]|nr:mCG1028489 [Mus musculus]
MRGQKRGHPLTSRASSLQASSCKMAAPSLITTSRKSQPCTWPSV